MKTQFYNMLDKNFPKFSKGVKNCFIDEQHAQTTISIAGGILGVIGFLLVSVSLLLDYFHPV